MVCSFQCVALLVAIAVMPCSGGDEVPGYYSFTYEQPTFMAYMDADGDGRDDIVMKNVNNRTLSWARNIEDGMSSAIRNALQLVSEPETAIAPVYRAYKAIKHATHTERRAYGSSRHILR